MEIENIKFREKQAKDNTWLTNILSELWGSTKIISKDKMYDALNLPGFIADQGAEPVGVILYAKEGKSCEIVALYSGIQRQGFGTKFIEMVKEIARKEKLNKIWLQTTNDNTSALRFYQKRGFAIAAVRPNVIEEQRRIKPIPLLGIDGIPIRDEIELEILLDN